MIIEYDKPFEVSEKQYKELMHKLSGVVAGRSENGKYYIKVWIMRYATLVRKFLTV
jgi:hypothetical protein